jgi:hypothetical protein
LLRHKNAINTDSEKQRASVAQLFIAGYGKTLGNHGGYSHYQKAPLHSSVYPARALGLSTNCFATDAFPEELDVFLTS